MEVVVLFIAPYMHGSVFSAGAFPTVIGNLMQIDT